MNTKTITIFILSFIFTLPTISVGDAQSKFIKTPSDMEGPFYPFNRRSDEDNNLIQVQGKLQTAQGDVLNLTGTVIDTKGIPQNNVIIELWQTDVNGLYDHHRDRSQGKRDPFFQYWGKATTDDQGKYHFKTLIPGEYEPRPAHIHFKVWVGKKVVLTSQMYILKNNTKASYINELLKLRVSKDTTGEYSGFFRIVI